ncbi:MAG: peptide deformylase [Deltaproteobacteria bacterium]|nr:peptide deformylase [Deltaproteobacteria bacterium]
MAILRIIKYPEPELRQSTQEVPLAEVGAPGIRRLVEDLVETMYSHNGAGLAAVQVGRPERIILIDGHVAGGAEDAPPVVLINPTIEHLADETETADEGCLSFPGIFVPIKRSLQARVSAYGLDGKCFTIEAEGLYARALQHETDHLTGRMIVDFVGAVKREIIKRKMKRVAREEAEEAEESPARRVSDAKTL